MRDNFADGAILYGSRDSFIPYYSGEYETCIVPPVPSQSGTDLRKECLETGTCTMSYRIGMIAAATDRFPIVFPTVDCAPWKKENGTYYILLGHKEWDEERYRFIGGFADKKDISYEAAITREFGEEAGGKITHKEPQYIGSCPVADHRYADTNDGVMTILFGIEYGGGEAIATDDIDTATWVAIDNVIENIVESHKPLAEKLVTYLKNKN